MPIARGMGPGLTFVGGGRGGGGGGGAPPELVSVSTSFSRTCSVPADVEDGDVIVLMLIYSSFADQNFTPDEAGWTSQLDYYNGTYNHGMHVWTRTISGDSGDYTFSPSYTAQITAAAFRGVTETGIINDFHYGSSYTSSQVTGAPAVGGAGLVVHAVMLSNTDGIDAQITNTSKHVYNTFSGGTRPVTYIGSRATSEAEEGTAETITYPGNARTWAQGMWLPAL